MREYINYKAKKEGVTVFFIDPRNTSRECSKCGHVAKENRKSQSEFVCVSCNFSHNADINAAINIRGRANVTWLKESKSYVLKSAS